MIRVLFIVVIRVHRNDRVHVQHTIKEDQPGSDFHLRAVVHAVIAVIEGESLLTAKRFGHLLVVDLVLDDTVAQRFPR